jgi:phospholipid/cholesterol/gamma-HCH transport system permease protein
MSKRRATSLVVDSDPAASYNRPMSRFFEKIGRWVVIRAAGFLQFCGYFFVVFRTLFVFFATFEIVTGRARTSIKILFKQVLFTGVDALPVISLVSLAIGAIAIIQSLTLLPRFGGESLVGNILVTVIVRELGPLLTGFIVIGRSGTAITAEIGNMVVSHEIEALESMGVDPIRYIVIPRVLGVTISLVVLNVYFDLFAIIGGFLVSKMVLVTSFMTFLERLQESVLASDIIISLAKGCIFGIIVSFICTFQGFSVRASSTEVPQMTTKAVVNAITFLFLADGVVTFIYYL